MNVEMKIGDQKITEVYELIPVDGRQSFYGKAKVMIAENGTRFLQSYDTIVAAKKTNGQVIRFYDDWSMTTGRHIKSFCGMNKAAFNKLPIEK